MSKTFQGRYEIEDGYAGGSRPQFFTIDAEELDDDMTDSDIASLYEDSAKAAFNQTTFFTVDSDDFLKWAREQLKARKEAESA